MGREKRESGSPFLAASESASIAAIRKVRGMVGCCRLVPYFLSMFYTRSLSGDKLLSILCPFLAIEMGSLFFSHDFYLIFLFAFSCLILFLTLTPSPKPTVKSEKFQKNQVCIEKIKFAFQKNQVCIEGTKGALQKNQVCIERIKFALQKNQVCVSK